MKICTTAIRTNILQVGLSRFAKVRGFLEDLPAQYGFEAPAEQDVQISDADDDTRTIISLRIPQVS